MRALTAMTAILSVAFALAAAPASAELPKQGHHVFWRPGAVFGVTKGEIALGVRADAYCVEYVPLRGDWSSLIGRRPTNAC